MGWRDRVKKSFGDSEHIGEGIQNSKKIEKERKEGSKTTFIYYPQNPQNPQNRQNRQNEGEKPKTEQGNTTSTVKDQSTLDPTPAQNIPAPSPASLGHEYDALWNKAWILADFVDGDTAPYADRKARLPELMQMRDRLAEIANRGTNCPKTENPTATSHSEEIKQIKHPGAWMPWESSTATRDRDPENCPARCRRTGKCYVAAYFKGKPGKPKDCEPETCKHKSNERGSHDSETT